MSCPMCAGERGIVRGAQDDGGIVGKDQVPTIVAFVDDRPHVVAGHLR